MSSANNQNNQETGMTSIKSLMNSDNAKTKFTEMLGKRSAAFITSVLQIVNSNQDLSKADPLSVYNVAATAATLDLPLNNNLQFCHIIPYKDNATGKVTATLQLGWRGYVQLAQRSSQFETINVSDVREGELKKRDRLTSECVFEWEQDDAKRSQLKVIGFVAYFGLVNGFKKSLFKTSAELEAHGARYSKTFNYKSSKWKTDFEAMCSKTVIKELLSKWAPLSIEMSAAIAADQAVIKGINGKEIEAEYPDNPIQEAEEITDEEAERIQREASEKQAQEAQDELKKKLEGKK